MFRLTIGFLALSILVVPSSSYAQDKSAAPVKTDVGVGLSMKKYQEVETELREGFPLILQRIKETADLVKKNEFEQGRAKLELAVKEAQTDEKVFTNESHYKEIADYVDKMEDFLRNADAAMAKKQKKLALQYLSKAYRYTKVIGESPVLKLAASEIELGMASRMIRQQNYKSAGIFLQRAIDNITSVQQDPKLDSQELKKLKNEIIITQQQVSLGKLQDEKRLKRFYPGLAAARVNTLNTYYSIWNRNDMPWEMY